MVKMKIKQIRMAKGLTLRQLSEMSDVSKSQLERIENNESMPAIDKLCDIAHALGVSVTDTFEYCYTKNPQY